MRKNIDDFANEMYNRQLLRSAPIAPWSEWELMLYKQRMRDIARRWYLLMEDRKHVR